MENGGSWPSGSRPDHAREEIAESCKFIVREGAGVGGIRVGRSEGNVASLFQSERTSAAAAVAGEVRLNFPCRRRHRSYLRRAAGRAGLGRACDVSSTHRPCPASRVRQGVDVYVCGGLPTSLSAISSLSFFHSCLRLCVYVYVCVWVFLHLLLLSLSFTPVFVTFSVLLSLSLVSSLSLIVSFILSSPLLFLKAFKV